MNKKIFIALTAYCLVLMFFSASVSEVGAQPRNRNNQTKPNEKARKLAAQGDQFFKQKDYRSAINKYAEAIVLSPNFPVAHYWKGYAHYYLNEFDAGIEDLDMALSQGFKPIDIYKLRWYLHFQKENYDAALKDVQDGLRLEPSNGDFISGQAEILVRKGAYPQAIEPLKQAILRSPKNGDLYFFLAYSYAQTGNTALQLSTAAEAVKNNSQYTGEAYKLMGDALAVSGKNAEAIQFYQKAINVKPQIEDAYVNLSNLFHNENRLNEAIETARRGLKLYPNNSGLLISLTWYFSLADRNGEAVNAGQQAVKIAPDNYMAYTNLCRAYNDMKDYQQAIQNCNKALKIKPSDGETFFYLGRAHDLVNKKDLAAQYFKKAVEGLTQTVRANPDADGHYLLGNAYYSDGQVNKAIESYKKSLALSPNFVKAHFNLGNMYILANNAAAAREQYQILLKLDKNYAEKLKQNLDKL